MLALAKGHTSYCGLVLGLHMQNSQFMHLHTYVPWIHNLSK